MFGRGAGIIGGVLGAEACPLLERAIGAFNGRDATSELEDARARMLIPR